MARFREQMARNPFRMLPISQRRLNRAEKAGIDTSDRLAIERFEATLHEQRLDKEGS